MVHIEAHTGRMLSLLLLMPTDQFHPVWASIEEDNNHSTVFAQIAPLVREAVKGNRPAARALAWEVMDFFSDPSDHTLMLISDHLVHRNAGVGLGRVWGNEVVAAALLVVAEGQPESLAQRAQGW